MSKWGSTDFKDLRKLQNKIDNYLKNQNILEDVAKELTARLLAEVIPRTPVGQYPASTGKVGGTLRRGWTSSSHNEAKNVGDNVNVKDYVNNLSIEKTKEYVIIEVINPVEYAKYVEIGHRTRNHKNWVEGQHFLRISVNEINSKKKDIVENIVYSQLKELFL